MSILGDLLGLWKSWAEREGKTRKEIAEYLDTVAQEATRLADAASETFAARPGSMDTSGLEIAVAQYCSAMKAVYENASLVLAKHPEVRESLLERVARVQLAPTSLKDQMRQLGYQKPKVLTGVDRLSMVLIRSPISDSEILALGYRGGLEEYRALERGKLKDVVVALNEEAGELRQLAATYRSAGKATRTKSKR